MIKDNTRFYPNLDSGCVRILKYAYAASNTDSKKKKKYIFIDLIKQTYNMWDQTSMLENPKKLN